MSFERFVVVGCGRSGTRYASELFTSMGLPCAHQKVFGLASELMGKKLPCNCGVAKGLRTNHESQCRATYIHYGNPIDWKGYVGASSAYAAPVLDKVDDSTLIIHQVRNPWRVAHSLETAKHLPGQNPSNLYGRHLPKWEEYDDLHLRGAYVWWQWNLMIERALEKRRWDRSIFIRVEDYSVEALTQIIGLLGREFTDSMARAFKGMKNNVGSVGPKGRPPTLEGMPHGFWGMVNRYDYARPA